MIDVKNKLVGVKLRGECKNLSEKEKKREQEWVGERESKSKEERERERVIKNGKKLQIQSNFAILFYAYFPLNFRLKLSIYYWNSFNFI